jgi:thiol:disulfide interchange protein DsbD
MHIGYLVVRSILSLLLLLAAIASVHASNSTRTEQVQITLLPEQSAAVPGETLWLGLRFELIPHWHVYWRNPGDSGEAPRVDWQLPTGWQAGGIHWPTPQRIPVGPLVNYGYEDRVMLLVPMSVPADQAVGEPVDIAADLTWLVCREECIPQQGRVQITLPVVAAGQRPAAANPFDDVRAHWPVAAPGNTRYARGAGAVTLRIDDSGWAGAKIDSLWFAADTWGPVAPSQAQDWRFDGDTLLVTLPDGEAPLADGATLNGLLVVSESGSGTTLTRGFTIDAPPLEGYIPARDSLVAQATGDPAVTLALALGLALLGGLLLNLMPCVLPVLSIKVLSLVEHAGDRSGRHGLVFAAGVLASFLALAGLLVALRAGGASLGWGFQLQEPWVVIALMYLMLALGLNLSGVFTLGSRLTGAGQSLTEHKGLRGTFATGVLAVVVASPCTAPFMGTALGFALTRPPFETLLVFAALGIGFALPVTLLAIWPRWVRLLPGPGAWMERLRNALAFPLYATAAWLLWVLSQQVDSGGLAVALSGSLLLAFGLWWLGQPMQRRTLRNAVGGLLVVASLALLVAGGQSTATPSTTTATTSVATATWSPTRVTELQQDGRAVLVNFTAAWCITCKVNEQVALTTDAVRQALDERRIAYLKADWTRRDPAITEELRRHGRSGVPLYLLYPAGQGDPEVLPQLLTEGLVLQALSDIPKS